MVFVAAMGVMKACLAREWILVKRNSFVYVFKALQVSHQSIHPWQAIQYQPRHIVLKQCSQRL